jgi:hypothetical protein
VSAARHGFYLLAAIAVLLLVVPPLVSRATNATLARYVESKSPGLDALVLSAAEARASMEPGGDAGQTSPALAERLVGKAAEECRVSPAVAELERTRTRRAAGGMAGLVAAAAILLMIGPEGWRHGAWLLLSLTDDPAAANPYAIHIAPGDVSVLAGDDVRIAATPDGFWPEGLILASRVDGEEAWTRAPLSAAPEAGVFETHFFDIAASVEYRVEHPVLSSPSHRIEVVPRPVAERIDLYYEFPDYTGRDPELVSDGGDISAVRGTRVEVRVTPSSPTGNGRLVLDGKTDIPLRADEDGNLRGWVEVLRDGRYHVELEAGSYGMASASPEHAIVAQPDNLPIVEVERPGRDVQVTSIEEIVVEATARDDVAVRDLELVVSVNGGPDRVLSLADGSRARPEMAARHEFFLEEHDLAPGDLIAYYARARDAADDGRQVTSDIYFMDVRPFEMSYRLGGGGMGGGGAGGQQTEETLAAQQRTVVVALFKLLRDRTAMDEPTFVEQVETLNTAQARIRERVDAIVRRLESRSIVQRSPGYRRMAEELPEASKAMIAVEALLAVRDVDEALPAARRALLHLQRADSAFREAQVAQGRQSGGGGGSAQNDLANLFRLEMDRFRSPYEDIQRGNWNPPDQQVDELMRKLRELAERQQRELERYGLQGRGGDRERQQALAEELEALARELERLTRRQSSESLRAAAGELDEAARAMRRAAGDADARAGAEALDRLREARRLLDTEATSRLARETQEALRRAEAMAESQSGIERDVTRTPSGQEPGSDRARALDLVERKQALADDVEEMESRLQGLAERAGRDRQAGAAEALENAVEQLRQGGLPARIRRSADRLAGTDEQGGGQGFDETAISRSLQNLRDRIASAAERLDASDEASLSRIHQALRDTLRGLEREHERTEDRARRGPALSGEGTETDRIDLANARGALDQQIGGIGGLAEALAADPSFDGDLNTLMNAIEAVQDERDTDAEARAQSQAALLAALRDIERELRARLDATAPAAWGSARSEPTPAHREDVETYYRNLSERPEP